MIKVSLSNEILKYITDIDKNRYHVHDVKIPNSVASKLRKNSKKKSSYASNKIEGNPLSERQVDEVIDSDERRHFLRPEQEVRNYFLALNYLEEKRKKKTKFSKKLILDVQKLVEKERQKKSWDSEDRCLRESCLQSMIHKPETRTIYRLNTRIYRYC